MKKKFVELLVRDVWRVGIGVFLALLILESLQRGFVSRFFNINLMVLFLLIVSVMLLVVQSPSKKKPKRDYASLQIIGVTAAMVVWVFLPETMRLFWRATATGGVLLIALFSWPLINNEK